MKKSELKALIVEVVKESMADAMEWERDFSKKRSRLIPTDKSRLDWLDKNPANIQRALRWVKANKTGMTFRNAIDQAERHDPNYQP